MSEQFKGESFEAEVEKMTEIQVVDLMKTSQSEEEWNQNCDKVKAEFDGDYPDFWVEVIVTSGVLKETRDSWEK